MKKYLIIAAALLFTGFCPANELKNPSFENGLASWNIEGDGKLVSDLTYGKIPDGKNMLHFRNAVWQNTGIELQEKNDYLISFHAASWGTKKLTVELRLAPDRNSAGELLDSFEVTFPLNELWAFRKEVQPENRKSTLHQFHWFCPKLPPEIKSGYLVLRIRAHEGYAGIDNLSLTANSQSADLVPLQGTLQQTMQKMYPGSKWLGNQTSGIVWQENRPLALAVHDGGGKACVKTWDTGKFFDVRFIDTPVTSLTNLDYAPPKIQSANGKYRMKWTGIEKQPVDLDIELEFPQDGAGLSMRFTIKNRSQAQIPSLTLPCGWQEPERPQTEFVIPAWVGVAVPLTNIKPIGIISPGHLHSQWFGLQDKYGYSWMLYTNDTDYNLKGLSIKSQDGKVNFSWSHELWLKPNRTYSTDYRTILKFWADADWNTMGDTYRSWAIKQRWFKPYAEKLKERPQIDQLRQGWSWLRGMPPVKEVGGRKCDTTYPQALECMAGFREKIGIDPLFWYTGWYGPFDSKYPEFFPVAPELGGNFEEFAGQVKARKHLVSVHINSGEWNSSASFFDKNLMAIWRGRYYENRYGDEHSNFVANLNLCKKRWIEEYLRITRPGINGIYFDVLGHVIAHDDNPRAGYKDDEIGRNNWTKSKVELWAAYRKAMPQTFFQTEANWEGSIPYLDANSGGSTTWMFREGRRPLPLWQMTYGDTGFFLMLYDGMGQANASQGFAVTPLFAAIQQYPQNLWKTMDPFWLHQVQRQLLTGELAATQMLKYYEYLKWRVSTWSQGIVIVNDGTERNGRFICPLGEIKLDGMARKDNGAVTIITASGISSDGANQVTLNGKVLWKCDSNRIAFTLNKGKLSLYNPTKENLSITISGDRKFEIPAGKIIQTELN